MSERQRKPRTHLLARMIREENCFTCNRAYRTKTKASKLQIRSNASKRAWETRKNQARLRARDMAEERAELVKPLEPAATMEKVA